MIAREKQVGRATDIDEVELGMAERWGRGAGGRGDERWGRMGLWQGQVPSTAATA